MWRSADVRPGVEVRAALPADLDDLVDLCLEARAEAAVGAQLCSSDARRLRHQLGTLLTVPGGHAMVAVLDDELAGLLLARVVGPSPFTEDVSVHMEALYVRVGRRRRGVGHALLVGAAQLAEESGAGHVLAVPLPGSRGVQRFLARLGFAPAAAHRVVALEVLQRRLAADPAHAGAARRGGTPGRGLEDLIARRRHVRALSGPVDLRGLPEALAHAEAAAQEPRRSSISRQVRRAVASRRDSESTTTIA